MNNVTAFALGALILGFFALDQFYLGWDAHIFIGRKLLLLIERLAVWR